jgi:hypothetical protein
LHETNDRSGGQQILDLGPPEDAVSRVHVILPVVSEVLARFADLDRHSCWVREQNAQRGRRDPE